MKMMVKCIVCPHEFGAWRARCDACGTPQKPCKHGLIPASCAVCNGTVRPIADQAKPRRLKERKDDECVLCRRRVRGKKMKPSSNTFTERYPTPRCPHCSEPCHDACKPLHVDHCQQFQVSRNTELQRLGVQP